MLMRLVRQLQNVALKFLNQNMERVMALPPLWFIHFYTTSQLIPAPQVGTGTFESTSAACRTAKATADYVASRDSAAIESLLLVPATQNKEVALEGLNTAELAKELDPTPVNELIYEIKKAFYVKLEGIFNHHTQALSGKTRIRDLYLQELNLATANEAAIPAMESRLRFVDSIRYSSDGWYSICDGKHMHTLAEKQNSLTAGLNSLVFHRVDHANTVAATTKFGNISQEISNQIQTLHSSLDGLHFLTNYNLILKTKRQITHLVSQREFFDTLQASRQAKGEVTAKYLKELSTSLGDDLFLLQGFQLKQDTYAIGVEMLRLVL